MISALRKVFEKNKKNGNRNRTKILVMDNCPEDLCRLQEKFDSIPHNFDLVTFETSGKLSEITHKIELEKPDLVVIDPSLGPNVLYPMVLALIQCHFEGLDIISFSRSDLNGYHKKFGIRAVVRKSDGFIALIQAISDFSRNKRPGNAM